MKTIKITLSHSNEIAEILGVNKNPWLVIFEGVVAGVFTSRTLARTSKKEGLQGSVIAYSELEKEGLELAHVTVTSEKVSHPRGYETHGFDNCPHCNIHLDNGVLQNGDKVGSRGEEILHLEKFECYCMACGQEFGPALQVAEVKEKTIRGPIAHESTVSNPCKLVWGIASDMKEANPLVKRGAVLEECVRQGIAYYTARTQYQSWLSVQKEMAAREAAQAKTK